MVWILLLVQGMARSRVRSYPAVVLAVLVSLAAVFCHVRTEAALAPVDRVVVYKGQRLLQLLKGEAVVRSYRVALGKNPVGPKRRAGDGRTPEGVYRLDGRNSASKFYKAIHISYPNAGDQAAARKNGVVPGGQIMIHGLPEGFADLADSHFTRNWTKGCIAVSNAEIDEIWRLVPNGTPIEIKP